MKRHILSAAGIALSVSLLTGCAPLFTSTDTPAYHGSDLIISVSKPENSESSSSGSGEQSSPESTSSASEPTPVPSEKHPRFLELEQQFSYDSNWKICLSSEELAFADKTLFVGDSICRGFAAYNVIKARSVYAAGSVGARNFFEKDFYYSGKETPYKELLTEMKPEQVILWMGLNDVNMTDAQEYCENYRKIIDFTLENSSANVYVCAISPINDLNYAENSRIDAFNLAMKNYIAENLGQRVGFLDFAYLLKDGNNMLTAGLDSGDGKHLAPEVYYIAMLEICHQLEIIY